MKSVNKNKISPKKRSSKFEVLSTEATNEELSARGEGLSSQR